MTNFHSHNILYTCTSSQFWASGQYLHSEINPQGLHNRVFKTPLSKYKLEHDWIMTHNHGEKLSCPSLSILNRSTMEGSQYIYSR